jgi:hypothetical protein
VITRESVLSAWYGSRPETRRLCALRDAQGRRVVVHVQRALYSNEIHPAWMANRDVWIDEHRLRTSSPVRQEHADEPFNHEMVTDAPGVIVAAFSLRDPTFS